MSRKRVTLWRWAKPSKEFTPTENAYFKANGIRFKSHNKVVRAGLNPSDWMEIVGRGSTLHRITLTEQQAKLCVVAEDDFRPTEEELRDFAKKTHSHLGGAKRRYFIANYEKSFVPLLEYSGGYNRPEVLIPFPVKAEIVPTEEDSPTQAS